MQSQEEELLRLKNESEQLGAQLEQAQGRNARTVLELDEKVNALTEVCEKRNRREENQFSELELLSARQVHNSPHQGDTD